MSKLKEYLPDFYADVLEMNHIIETEEVELKIAFNTVNEVLDAFFIRKTNDNTVKNWEKQFGVNLAGKDLAEKKRELLSLMLGFSKLTCEKIEQITLTKTTYKANSYVEDSKIFISFNDIGYPDDEGMAEVIAYIEQLKPAHLGIEVILKFRTHARLKSKQHKHEHLKNYTHLEIRERREEL